MAHVGAPGLAIVNSELMVVYRDGPQHDVDTGATRGIIYRETSSDGGSTWGTKTAVVNDTVNEYDARNPIMLVTSADTVLVGYTLSQSATVHAAYVARSTDNGSSWSQIAVTNSFTDWAISGSTMVEAANGDILAALYGEDTGDTDQSARVSKSSDDGATWSHLAEIADGPGASRSYQEPALVRLANDDILCIMRTDDDVFYSSTSTDDGATWSAPSAMSIAAASGRPAPLLLSDGWIALWYRHPINLKLGVARFSDDDGATWTSPMLLRISGLQAMYAQMVETAPGEVGIAYGSETNSTASVVFYTTLVTD